MKIHNENILESRETTWKIPTHRKNLVYIRTDTVIPVTCFTNFANNTQYEHRQTVNSTKRMLFPVWKMERYKNVFDTTYTHIFWFYVATAHCVLGEVHNRWLGWGTVAILDSFASNTTHPVQNNSIQIQKEESVNCQQIAWIVVGE